jgi:hypothetical protein
MDNPKPGAPDAVKAGCECPVIDNHHGKGAQGKPDMWWINSQCPMHGDEIPPHTGH